MDNDWTREGMSPLLDRKYYFMLLNYSFLLSTPPMFMLYSATTAGLGTSIWLFCSFSHLEQVSWGSIPWATDAMTTGLLSTHLMTAISSGLRTIISNDPLGFLLRALSTVKWHYFGILFFGIVPVTGRSLSGRVSRSLMVVKYRSK